MNEFVEEAPHDWPEELDDIQDLKRILHEPTRPLTELIAELQIDGDL